MLLLFAPNMSISISCPFTYWAWIIHVAWKKNCIQGNRSCMLHHDMFGCSTVCYCIPLFCREPQDSLLLAGCTLEGAQSPCPLCCLKITSPEVELDSQFLWCVPVFMCMCKLVQEINAYQHSTYSLTLLCLCLCCIFPFFPYRPLAMASVFQCRLMKETLSGRSLFVICQMKRW